MPPSGNGAESKEIRTYDVGLQDQANKKDAESDADVDGLSCNLPCQDLVAFVVA